MSNSLNEARLPSLKDKLDEQEVVRQEEASKASKKAKKNKKKK